MHIISVIPCFLTFYSIAVYKSYITNFILILKLNFYTCSQYVKLVVQRYRMHYDLQVGSCPFRSVGGGGGGWGWGWGWGCCAASDFDNALNVACGLNTVAPCTAIFGTAVTPVRSLYRHLRRCCNASDFDNALNVA